MRRIKISSAFIIAAALMLASCGGVSSASRQGSADASGEGSRNISIPGEQLLVCDYTVPESVSPAPGISVAMIVMDLRDGYWDAVREGAEQAVKDVNAACGYDGDDAVKLVYEGTKDPADVDGQINTIDSILSENPAAMCISAIDMTSCEPQLKMAKDNGIPVIMMDSGVESPMITSLCMTDNISAARMATDKLCEAVGDEGDIAVLAHVTSAQSSSDRMYGFAEEIADHPAVHVAARLAQNDGETIETMIGMTLEMHPDLKGILCTSEATAGETLDALKKLGRQDVAVVGFDTGKKQCEAVRSGDEYGLVTQNPRAIGYVSVIAALRAESGEKVDPKIDTGFLWVDSSNIDGEEVASYLYE